MCNSVAMVLLKGNIATLVHFTHVALILKLGSNLKMQSTQALNLIAACIYLCSVCNKILYLGGSVFTVVV